MSIASGAFTVKRVQVLQPPQELSLDWLLERARKYAIRPIDFEDDREESTGWCHPFTGLEKFQRLDDIIHDNILILGMRTDTKKIPATLLRIHMRTAIEGVLKTMSKDHAGPKRLPKAKRDEIKERVKHALLTRALPQIRIVEIAWHLDSNEIWLTSFSNSVFTAFEKLFNETFELPFVHINPGTLSIDFDKVLAGTIFPLDKLAQLSPLDLLGITENETQSHVANAINQKENNTYF